MESATSCCPGEEIDNPKEKCGLFGIFDSPGAVEKAYFGLHSLQHRGQESSGMAISDGERIFGYTGMGLVSEVFTQAQLRDLSRYGDSAIGHVRYSTSGSSRLENAQPILRWVRWRWLITETW